MDLFGLKAKANAKLELNCRIESVLSDGVISDAEYQQLLQYTNQAGLKESELQTMIREVATKLLNLKIKTAIKDFRISIEEYENLWSYAQAAKLSKSSFDAIIIKNQQDCLCPYIKQVILRNGKLSQEQRQYIKSLGVTANLTQKQIDSTIDRAMWEYKQNKIKKIKERFSKFIRIFLITIGIIAILLLIYGLTKIIIQKVNAPKKPIELCVSPDPLFVLDDCLSGEIAGYFTPKSMPDGSKLIITPYINVEGKHYYGSPVIYMSENFKSDDMEAIIVPKNGYRFTQKLHIDNPTYGKNMNLCLKFEAFNGETQYKIKDQCLAPVWNAESLKADLEHRIKGPYTLAAIFFLLAIILVVIIILSIKGGWFSWILGVIALPLMIVFILLVYFPMRHVNAISSEIDNVSRQFDNAIRVHSRQNGAMQENNKYQEVPLDSICLDNDRY